MHACRSFLCELIGPARAGGSRALFGYVGIGETRAFAGLLESKFDHTDRLNLSN